MWSRFMSESAVLEGGVSWTLLSEGWAVWSSPADKLLTWKQFQELFLVLLQKVLECTVFLSLQHWRPVAVPLLARLKEDVSVMEPLVSIGTC